MRADVSLEPSMLEPKCRLGSSMLEHNRVIPCAISRNPGFMNNLSFPAFPGFPL